MFRSRTSDGALSRDRARLLRRSVTRGVVVVALVVPYAAAGPVSHAAPNSIYRMGSAAWGDNAQGQLGLSGTQTAHTAAPMPGMTVFSQVSAGGSHTIALAKDGTVWTWGANYYGALGNGTTAPSLVPTQVPGLSGVVDVAADLDSSFAVDAAGTLWAWGLNLPNAGNLGLGAGAPVTNVVPQAVPGISGVADVEVGWHAGYARDLSGSLWTWGSNQSGTLANGTYSGYRPYPAKVPGVANVIDLATSRHAGMALRADGWVLVWGHNFNQLFGEDPISATPLQLFRIPGLQEISAGLDNGAGLQDNGRVWTWGNNEHGQAGVDLSRTSVWPPHLMQLGQRATWIEVGLVNTYALREDGTVWAWGGNSSGSVGTGSLAEANHDPAPVIGVDNATYVGSGPTADHVVVVQPVLTDFALTLDPGAGSVIPGGSVEAGLSLTPLNGFSATAALSVTGPPPHGITIKPSATQVSEGKAVTITVRAAPYLPPGVYAFAISGAVGSTVRSVPFSLTVTPPP